MNRTNWEHVGYGAAITVGAGLALSVAVEYIGLRLGYYLVGALCAIFFFYGRETRDAQIDKALSDFWMLSPANWSPDGRRDFFPMAAAALLLAALIDWWWS